METIHSNYIFTKDFKNSPLSKEYFFDKGYDCNNINCNIILTWTKTKPQDININNINIK